MSDGTMTAANVTISDVPAGTTVTEDASSQAHAPGSGTELGADSEPKSDNAGGPQGSPEDGQQGQGQRRGWSKVDEIRDLRAWRREARQREAGYQSELAGVRQQLEELRQLQQPNRGKAERDPSKFWQDPEAAIERNLEER